MFFTDIYYCIFGIAMGLSLAAPPGPVNAMIATEATRSKIHGLSVGLGATSADFTYLIIMLIFGSVIPATVINYLYMVGGILMLYLAYRLSKPIKLRTKPHGNYLIGYVLAISSPFNLAWWLTAGLFMLKTASAYSILGLFLGILAWILIFSSMISRLNNASYAKWIRYASAVLFAAFGIFMLYHSLAIAA